MKYAIVPVTPFQQNCSLLWCEATKRAAVVDPGGDLPRILKAAEAAGVTIEKILVTHGHADHAAGTKALADQLGVPVEGPHTGDGYWIDGMADQCRMFGFPPSPSFTPDRWLADGDTVTVGEDRLSVIHCPGHTPGHVVFYNAASKLAAVGDVLFQGSVGRTDFPGGNHEALIRSIKDKLFPLGDDVAFIPGHGPMSTFGDEKRFNPFVRG